eukprot:15435467-Alexandrium_andersonii.AAC.1
MSGEHQRLEAAMFCQSSRPLASSILRPLLPDSEQTTDHTATICAVQCLAVPRSQPSPGRSPRPAATIGE